MNSKTCKKCGELKPASMFNGKNKNAKDGLQGYCRECNKVYLKQWKKDAAAKKAKIRYNKTYNSNTLTKCTNCKVRKHDNRLPVSPMVVCSQRRTSRSLLGIGRAGET